MHITLRQLEVFAEVLKSGSTTQASVMLSLSQSAVSAALTDLEGQLGVQLFDRVGKRLVGAYSPEPEDDAFSEYVWFPVCRSRSGGIWR